MRAFDEEPDVGGSGADDDVVGIGKRPTVDVQRIISGTQTLERAMHAAREFVGRRRSADRLTHRKRENLVYA